MKIQSILTLTALFLLVPLDGINAAELKLASVFSDHMVLQRDMPVPVWGWANTAENVTVEFFGQTRKATADVNGKWLVKLDALSASAEPRTLTVRGSARELKCSDVVVGEVWLSPFSLTTLSSPTCWTSSDKQ